MDNATPVPLGTYKVIDGRVVLVPAPVTIYQPALFEMPAAPGRPKDQHDTFVRFMANFQRPNVV